MKPLLRQCPRTRLWFCYRHLSFGVGISAKAAFDAAIENEKVVLYRISQTLGVPCPVP